MSIRGSYIDLVKIFQELDSISVMDHRYFIDQYEESVFRHGKSFFIDSHYQYRYARSLFAAEQYRKFLSECKPALSFLLNYEDWDDFGRENYKSLLYEMASAHVCLEEYNEYKFIRKQLVDLDYSKIDLKQLRISIWRQRFSPVLSIVNNKYFLYSLVALATVSISYVISMFLFY